MKMLFIGMLECLNNYAKILARRACCHDWNEIRKTDVSSNSGKNPSAIIFTYQCKKCGGFSVHHTTSAGSKIENTL